MYTDQMAKVLYAHENDELMGEVRSMLESVFKRMDPIEDGPIEAVHVTNRLTGKETGRIRAVQTGEFLFDDQATRGEFEELLEGTYPNHSELTMVLVAGSDNDFRVYVLAKDVEEVRDVLLVHGVLAS